MSRSFGEPPTSRQVTSELTELRRRGIDRVDELIAGKAAESDGLERLAQAYLGDTAPSSRADLLRRYIDEALTDFERGSPTEATFIRSLFFDARGDTPGPDGAGALKAAAIKRFAIRDDRQFDAVRATRFRLFAEFLTTLPTQPAPKRQGISRTIYVGIAVVILIVAGILVVTIPDWGSTASRRTPPNSGPSTAVLNSGAAGSVMFRFDTHGDAPHNVLVYPGPLANAADRTSDGDFLDQQEVVATCIATGRSVTFSSDSGGPTVTSDRWVRIDTGAQTIQYATLAYGELVPATSTLPQCEGIT